MFGNTERMEQLRDFTPTSKTQLRRFCMWFSEGNVQKAKEMYDFYSADIELPDLDPIPPTKMQAFKESAESVMGFVRENQEDIVTALGFVKSLFGRGNAVEKIVEPITKIN